jgi:ADP-heptose:LPS heptosyltransferase
VAALDFSQIRKLLIIRDDRVGDLVLTLPLASVIKAARPDIEVHFLVRAYVARLAERHPGVAKVLVLPDDLADAGAYARTVAAVAREAYDLAIVVHTTHRLARLVRDARIRYRMGNGLRWYSWRYNVRVYQRRSRPEKHELDYNLDLIRPYVPVPPRDQIGFGLGFGPDAERAVAVFLAERPVSRFLIVHPGSGGSAVDLPLETLAAWIDSFAYTGSFVVTGDSRETHLYERLASLCRTPLVTAVSRFDLEELVALIARCDLLVANSTGPLHIARALGRPLLGFYSTVAACHPVRWGPYNQERTHTLLAPGESYDRYQPNKQKCREAMRRITPEMINQKLRTIIPEAEGSSSVRA